MPRLRLMTSGGQSPKTAAVGSGCCVPYVTDVGGTVAPRRVVIAYPPKVMKQTPMTITTRWMSLRECASCWSSQSSSNIWEQGCGFWDCRRLEDEYRTEASEYEQTAAKIVPGWILALHA